MTQRRTVRRYRVALRLWVILSVVMALTATLSTFVVLYVQRPFVLAGRLAPNAENIMFAAAAGAGAVAAIGGLGLGLVVTRRIWAIIDRAEAAGIGRTTLDHPGTTVRDELGALDAAVGRLTMSMNRFVSDSDILARLPTAMLLVDENERLLSWNTTAETLIAPDLAQFYGTRISGEGGVFFGAAGSDDLARVVRDALGSAAPVQAEDVPATTRDGRRLLFDVEVQRRRGRAHEGHVFVLLLRDASEKRRIREEIRRADQLALLGGMTAQVAHEVRTPLATVRGLVELLQADLPPSDRCRQFTDRILSALDRQERLVRKLLTLTHPEPEAWEAVALPELLEEILMAWPARRPIVEILAAVRPVQGDAVLLGEVFTNLLQNAVEASPSGEISVRVAPEGDGGSMRVTVSNDGAGIPPEIQERIFQPFFTTKPRGTGLGLAIARHVVEAHHGSIHVDSDGRTSTHFVVSLPALQPAEALVAHA